MSMPSVFTMGFDGRRCRQEARRAPDANITHSEADRTRAHSWTVDQRERGEGVRRHRARARPDEVFVLLIDTEASTAVSRPSTCRGPT
jgi:hypothetical protein